MFKVGDIVTAKTKSGKSNYHEVTEVRYNNCIVIKSFKGNPNMRFIVNASVWTLDKTYHRRNKLLKLKEKING